jgi:hypothetical protein
MKVTKKFLNKFKYIEGACTAVVQCMATVDELMLSGKDDNMRYYVPLRVFRAEDIDKITDTVNVDNDDDKFEIEDIYPFVVSGVIWKNSINDTINLPIKGEKVLANFEYDENEKLVCTNIVPITKIRLKTFNLEKFTYNKKYEIDE